MYTLDMQELSISEFRQRCLSLMDDLPPEGILITRHGHPVARLTPVEKRCTDLIGSVPGIEVDPADDLLSTGVKWNAES